MAYATTADLATYLGIPEADLPADSTRQLQRASELLDYATMGRTTATETADAAKSATMAQVEFWLEAGEESDIYGSKNFRSHSIGGVSIQGRISELAPRAKRILSAEGLLYRGVSQI
jgi:hypothetical protein